MLLSTVPTVREHPPASTKWQSCTAPERLSESLSRKPVEYGPFPGAACESYFVFHNFCSTDKTLKITPAMAVGVTNKFWSMEDIVAQIDAEN
jgi:hypothetical protein